MTAERKPDVHPGGSMYDVSANDPDQVLIDRTGISEAEVAQISELMQALGELRQAEDRLNEASQEYMNLGRTDMLALHFLIVEENQGRVTTAGAIATHLRISTASTTKLLDRLARGGHIIRSSHPTDRRALAIRITPATRQAAYETVGTQHARRFSAAARLTSQERDIVIKFLRDTTAEISKATAFPRTTFDSGGVDPRGSEVSLDDCRDTTNPLPGDA